VEEQRAESAQLLDPLSKILIELGTGRNILILLVSLVVFSFAILGPMYARIETLSGGVGAMDRLILYSPDKAYDMVAAYGQQGRQYYATIALTLDTIFPLLLALTFSSILASVFHRAFSREEVLQRAVLVPVAAMMADLLENIGIVTMLLSYPRKLLAVALLASAFSTVKWTALAAEAMLVIAGLMAWLIQRVRRRGESRRGTPGNVPQE
jgi:hypothetical protein